MSQNIFQMVLGVLWSAFRNTLGLTGIPPLYFGYAVAAVLALAFGAQIYGGVRGRKSWSLDEAD